MAGVHICNHSYWCKLLGVAPCSCRYNNVAATMELSTSFLKWSQSMATALRTTCMDQKSVICNLLHAIAFVASPMGGVTAMSRRRLPTASGSQVKSAKEIDEI
jgi:hypothetical protein